MAERDGEGVRQVHNPEQMRRRRKEASIVLQKHVRAFVARKRVFNLRENKKRQSSEEAKRIKQSAMRHVMGADNTGDEYGGNYQQQQYQQQEPQYDDEQYPQSQQYNNDQQYYNDSSGYNTGGGGGGDGWIEAYDAATGQKYFYNNYTGETQWC